METAVTNKKLESVPKLRFSEFNDEWSSEKLEDKASFFSGGTPTSTNREYYNGKISFIKSGEISSNRTSQFISGKALENSSAKLVCKGDLLFALYGAIAGEVSISKINGAINQAVLCIGGEFNNIFLCNRLINRKEKILKTYLQGGQGNLSAKIVKELKIYFPTISEQQKIADFLSSVDKKIRQLTQKKELLEEYKKSVMQKLFPPADGQVPEIRFKDENGEDFPGWEEKKLDDLGKFSKGKGIPKKDIEEDGSLACIRYGELYTEYRESITEVVSRTNLKSNNLVLSQSNDVLIPSSGETHVDIATASCVLKDGVALGGDINIFRTKQSGVFMAYYLNSAYKFKIASLAQGNSIIHLYSSQLKTLEIYLPSIKEQKRIVNFLAKIDRKIETLETQIEVSKTFKKGLLQQMFV